MSKNLLQKILNRLWVTFKYIRNSNRAETAAGELPPFKIAEVIIKGTTYIVKSFSKKGAKSSVVDKIGRLIERDAAKLSEK